MNISAKNKKSSSKKQDDLARELTDLIHEAHHRMRTRILRNTNVRLDHITQAENELMQNLTIYITSRDEQVYLHGLEMGKLSVKRNNQSSIIHNNNGRPIPPREDFKNTQPLL